MTSTVLDVTVLLLCVSASVVALGGVDGGHGDASVGAAAVGDLLATETVTVTYASDEAPNGTRTVHATRAELLALMAAGGEEPKAAAAFESEARSVIGRGLGPRTRIDAAVVPRESAESPDTVGVGSEPPRGADVTATVVTHPNPNGSSTAETVRIVVRRWGA